MKERPILFSTPMVQAILAGTKTQTRRIKGLTKVNVRVNDWAIPVFDPSTNEWVFTAEHGTPEQIRIKSPYGLIFDELWVRETFAHTSQLNIHPSDDENYGFVYKADAQPWDDNEGWRWKPSIFMPRDASRIKLKITGIKIERLQDILVNDVIAEGCDVKYTIFGKHDYTDKNYITRMDNYAAKSIYYGLWDAINGDGASRANPFVWVIEFKKQ